MLRITLAVAAMAVVDVGPTHAQTTVTTLQGTVGPGYTITLKKGSTVVRSLKRGKYTIAIRDRSQEHNFHLRGPVSRTFSSIGWTGSKTVTVTLKAGRYTYVCDPHADEMRGGFRVT